MRDQAIATTTGHAIDDDDMHWEADCPQCHRRYEYTGFFDPEEPDTCIRCGCTFRISRVWMDDGSYIQ